MYLSSYCAIGLSWRRRLKDPLLLLWWQCGIQWNDFDVSNLRSKVIYFTLDPFAGLINFLKENLDLTLCVLRKQYSDNDNSTGPVMPAPQVLPLDQ